mmetsp:Transcript_1332/g.3185  ORF Transcript_1332/g.3185 Transcript_1332/m.3185 type:complete len:268 (+) Transcript_1332:1012-1815(+)
MKATWHSGRAQQAPPGRMQHPSLSPTARSSACRAASSACRRSTGFTPTSRRPRTELSFPSRGCRPLSFRQRRLSARIAAPALPSIGTPPAGASISSMLRRACWRVCWSRRSLGLPRSIPAASSSRLASPLPPKMWGVGSWVARISCWRAFSAGGEEDRLSERSIRSMRGSRGGRVWRIWICGASRACCGACRRLIRCTRLIPRTSSICVGSKSPSIPSRSCTATCMGCRRTLMFGSCVSSRQCPSGRAGQQPRACASCQSTCASRHS